MGTAREGRDGDDPMICKYPECRRKAEHTWALVDLCEPHHKALRAETRDYYKPFSGGIPHKKRLIYLRIADQIPWSTKVQMKKKKVGGKNG